MNAKTKMTEAVETATTTAQVGFDKTVAGLKDGMSAASAGMEKGQAQLKEGMEKAMKTAEEMVSFSQGNLEAVMKSGQIWAAGVQDIGKHLAAHAQSTMEATMAAMKAMASVKSVKDAFDLQAHYARQSMETAMTETGKITDASFKLAEQAIAPITARVTLAVEKFSKTAA